MASRVLAGRVSAALMFLAAALAFTTALSFGTQSPPREAVFLVAKPELRDPLFQETVILMLPPDRLPLVVGLIVNKPIKVRLHDLFPHSLALKNRADSAYFGGPVDVDEPSLAFREERRPVHAIPVFNNVYVSLDPKLVVGMFKGQQIAADLRLYLGRAQWSLNQLYGEMLEGSWYIVPAEPSFVFSSDPQTVWPTLVKRAQMRPVSYSSRLKPGMTVLFPGFAPLAQPTTSELSRHLLSAAGL